MAIQFSFKSGDGSVQRFTADFTKFEVTANYVLKISIQSKSYTMTGNFFSIKDIDSNYYSAVPYYFAFCRTFMDEGNGVIGMPAPNISETMQATSWGGKSAQVIYYVSYPYGNGTPPADNAVSNNLKVTLGDGTAINIVLNSGKAFLTASDSSLFYAVRQNGKPVLMPLNNGQCPLAFGGSAIFRGTAQSATFICQLTDSSAIKQGNALNAGKYYRLHDFTNGNMAGMNWKNEYSQNGVMYPTPSF